MRILFSCLGAYGHFHPIAPMALATQQKGHDTVVATGPDFVDWVTARGLRAAPVGLSADEAPPTAKSGAPYSPSSWTTSGRHDLRELLEQGERTVLDGERRQPR